MPATIVKTIGGTSPDYATWTLWEAAIPSNLVTADEIWEGQGRDVLIDEENVDIGTGITTDSTRFIRLRAEDGTAFNGDAGNGPGIDKQGGTGSDGYGFRLSANYTQIINIEITNSRATVGTNFGDWYIGIMIGQATDFPLVLRNIVHDLGVINDNMAGIGQRSTPTINPTVYVIGNIIYRIGNNDAVRAKGIELSLWGNSSTWYIIGNSLHWADDAWQAGSNACIALASDGGAASTINIYNNVSTSRHVDFRVAGVGASTINGSHNASGDLTASDLGGNEVESITAADVYVSVTTSSEDLHLKSGSVCIGAGSDRGTTPFGVEFDIDGYDRDAGAVTWDIGADQFGKDASDNGGGGIDGIADFNLLVLTITGIGDGVNRGIADFSLPVPTITGIGDVPRSGIADFDLPVPTITGIGNVPRTGSADFDLPVISITGLGSILARFGNADFDLPVPTITGIGGVLVKGVADFDLPVLTITGLGETLHRFGLADFNLPILAITAIGNIPIDGTADFNLPSLTIPAIGDILIKGVADFDLPNLGLSAIGLVGALPAVVGTADFNLPSLWINTQGGVDIPMVNIFSTSGQTGAETGTAFTLSRKAGTWFINRDVLAQVILGSGSATIHIEVSLDGGSTFADITSSVTASTISAFNLPPIIRVRLSAATAATVNVWLDADLVVTRVNN